MNIMQQMGINFGSGGAGGSGPVPTSVSLADVGLICQENENPQSSSKNATKLRKIFNETSGVIDNPVVICFKIGNEEPIYADFNEGKGKFNCNNKMFTTKKTFYIDDTTTPVTVSRYFDNFLGQVYEDAYSGEVSITLTLPQALFDSLMDGASQSQFLQAYLGGQITIDGDMQTLMELQKLLPNKQHS